MSPDRNVTKIGAALRVLAARLAAKADGLDRAEVERLTELANSLGTSELDLDEYVHDLASSGASGVNNSGLAGQVAYLVREAGPAEAERMIRGAAEEPDDQPEGYKHYTAADAEADATGYDPGPVRRRTPMTDITGARMLALLNEYGDAKFGDEWSPGNAGAWIGEVKAQELRDLMDAEPTVRLPSRDDLATAIETLGWAEDSARDTAEHILRELAGGQPVTNVGGSRSGAGPDGLAGEAGRGDDARKLAAGPPVSRHALAAAIERAGIYKRPAMPPWSLAGLILAQLTAGGA